MLVFYSAWQMKVPFLSLGWFLYCLSWIPLTMLFISVHKYDSKKKKTYNLLKEKAMDALKITVKK